MVLNEFKKENNQKIIIFKGCNDNSKKRLRRLKRFKRSIDQLNADLESIL